MFRSSLAGRTSLFCVISQHFVLGYFHQVPSGRAISANAHARCGTHPPRARSFPSIWRAQALAKGEVTHPPRARVAGSRCNLKLDYNRTFGYIGH